MLVIENCNSLSDLRQKLIDGEEVRTARQEPCDDMVSRDMALEKMADYVASGYADSVKDFEEYSRIICQLPPVNPTKTGHWIPVSEKLPDKEGHYLCSVRYMYPPYNFFEPEKVKYMDDVTIQKFDGEFNIEVKAWMPLPEPARLEEDNG